MKKYIALVLALVMALTLAACSGTKAMSYEEYAAAPLDAEVVVETYVQDTQSWWFDDSVGHGKITVYAQSEDGAVFIYEMNCEEEDAAKLVPGTKIVVSGYKGEFSGEIEILDSTFEFGKGKDTFIAEPIDATALLGTDELIDHQNEFASFKGMTVEPSIDPEGNEVPFLYSWDGSGDVGNDVYFNVSVNGATYNFVIESYHRGPDSEVYQAAQNLQIGQVVDMEGFLYWYEGVNPHITSITVVG